MAGRTTLRDIHFLRTPVRVGSVIDRQIEIESLEGKRWTVLWWQIDSPRTHRFPNDRREYTEWHPRVRALIQQNLEIHRVAETGSPDAIRQRNACIEALEWQLERSAQPHPMAGGSTARKR